MSIELIDKIKPYGGGDFAMVEAQDIDGLTGHFGLNIHGNSTGFKGYKYFDFPATIDSWILTSKPACSVVVDLKKCNVGALPATVSIIDTGSGGAKPELSNAILAGETFPANWDLTIAAGDAIEFYIDSASGVTIAVLQLSYTRLRP